MKKAFLFLIIAAMIVTLCAVCVSAADPSLKLTKTVYAEGEEVIAIASGDGAKDWIGVYKKNEKPGGGTVALQWYYVKDFNGVEANTTKDAIVDAQHPADVNLPVGEYIAYYLLNDGYTAAAQVEFKVVPESEIVPETPMKTETAPATADLGVLITALTLAASGAFITFRKRK